MCNEEGETTNHLFFSCRVSYMIWVQCNKWLGFDSIVLPQDGILQHVQWRQGKRMDALWKVTWFATIWSIWLLRNSIMSRGGQVDLLSVLELIKMRSWWWLKARAKNFKATFYEWDVDPVYCLRLCSQDA